MAYYRGCWSGNTFHLIFCYREPEPLRTGRMEDRKMRKEVKDLHNLIMSDCKNIRNKTSLADATNWRTAALNTLIDACENYDISRTMYRFLKRKVLASMVEGGFKSSEICRAFSSKESKRYMQLFY